MNEMQRAAFLQAQAACAIVEGMGLLAHNQEDIRAGRPPAFGRADFEALIERYGIGHNAALSWLQGR